jgi:hypothetical protein
MRRCPVAAWEGWTTNRDVHEDSERAAEGKPSAAQSHTAAERRNRSAFCGEWRSDCSVSSRGSLEIGARREHGSRHKGTHTL